MCPAPVQSKPKTTYVMTPEQQAVQDARDKFFDTHKGINPVFLKACLTREDLAEAMSAKLFAEAGVIISTNHLLVGGTFKKEVNVINADGKTISGIKDRKGFVKASVEGGCGYYAQNHATGEEIRGSLTIDDVDQYLSSFNKSDLDERGWLRSDLVMKKVGSTAAPQRSEQATLSREQIEAERQRREQEEAILQRGRQDNAARLCQTRFATAQQNRLNFTSNQPDVHIPMHGNHQYLVDKYDYFLPNIEPYLQNTLIEKNNRPIHEQVLLVPGYRSSDDKLINIQPIQVSMEGDKYEYKSNGKYKYSKKNTPNAEKTGMYHPVFNHPTNDTEIILAGEGLTSAAAFAIGMDVLNDPNKDKIAVISVFDANNAFPTLKTMAERFPNATIIYATDNDLHKYNQAAAEGRTIRNAGLDAANKLETIGIPSVTPDISLLHNGQSDWDDVLANIRDTLTERNGSPASFDETMQYFQPLVQQTMQQTLENFKERLAQINSELQQNAGVSNETVNQAQEQYQAQQTQQHQQEKVSDMLNPSIPERSITDDIVLAASNVNFKKLLVNVMDTLKEYPPTQHWSNELDGSITLLNQMPIDPDISKKHTQKELAQASRNTLESFAKLITAGTTHNYDGIDNRQLVATIGDQHWVQYGGVNPKYVEAFNSAVDNVATNTAQQPSQFDKPKWLGLLQDAIADKIIETANAMGQPVPATNAPLNTQTHQKQVDSNTAYMFRESLKDHQFANGVDFLVGKLQVDGKYESTQVEQLRQAITQTIEHHKSQPATFPRRESLVEASSSLASMLSAGINDKEKLIADINTQMPVLPKYKNSFISTIQREITQPLQASNQHLPSWTQAFIHEQPQQQASLQAHQQATNDKKKDLTSTANDLAL